MDLENIIAEIHTLTTGIYYKQLKELLNFLIELPYEEMKNYKIICKEVVYRECKKIGDYLQIETLKYNMLPNDVLATCVNFKWYDNFNRYIE